jgi:hypothetical protein
MSCQHFKVYWVRASAAPCTCLAPCSRRRRLLLLARRPQAPAHRRPARHPPARHHLHRHPLARRRHSRLRQALHRRCHRRLCQHSHRPRQAPALVRRISRPSWHRTGHVVAEGLLDTAPGLTDHRACPLHGPCSPLDYSAANSSPTNPTVAATRTVCSIYGKCSTCRRPSRCSVWPA